MAHRNSFFQIFVFICLLSVCFFTAPKTEAQEPLETFPPGVMVHGQSQVIIMEGAELGEGKVTSDGFVSIGNNVEIAGNVETLGSVTTGQRNEIGGDIRAAGSVRLGLGTRVEGEVVRRAQDIEAVRIPEVQVAVGEEDFQIPEGAWGVKIVPGRYRHIHVRRNTVLALVGGRYEVASLEVEEGGQLWALAPSEVLVQGQLSLHDNSQMRLRGVTETERDLRIDVVGVGGMVFIGEQAKFHGLLSAPERLVMISSQSRITGTILGGQVWIQSGAEIQWEAGCEVSEEVCDGLDNDCDGQMDEGLEPGLAENQQGICEGALLVCAGVAGWQEPDYNALDEYELMEESCDGLDNDCNGQVDDGFDTTSDPNNCGQCGVVCGEIDPEANGCFEGGCVDLSDGRWLERTMIVADEGAQGERFGSSLSLDGRRLLVGTPNDGQGVAYIYELEGIQWVEQAKLIPDDGVAGDHFGRSVSLEGSRAVIGAPDHQVDDRRDHQGAVYIFEHSQQGWTQTDKITDTTDGEENGCDPDRRIDPPEFGHSVSLSGSRILVGALADEVGCTIQGSAFMYELTEGNWIQTKKFDPFDQRTENFGVSVSLDGDRVLIGSHSDDVGITQNQGAAYIFEYDNITRDWNEVQRLTAGDGLPGPEEVGDGREYEEFGFSVCLDGDRALIGAKDAHGSGGQYVGAAYIFEPNNGRWHRTAFLTASNGVAEDRFGYSVSLSGDRALVGAAFAEVDINPNRPVQINFGAAYLFERVGNDWIEKEIFTAQRRDIDEQFGSAVSLDGNRAVVASPQDPVGENNNQGSVTVFELAPIAE